MYFPLDSSELPLYPDLFTICKRGNREIRCFVWGGSGYDPVP